MRTPIQSVTHTILNFLLAGMACETLASQSDWKHSANMVITHQTTNESGIDNESSVSGDWVVSRQYGAGTWLAHIEGSSSPETAGVSALLPEANGDIGTSLNKEGDGRIQLSEFYYTYTSGNDHILYAGVLDVSGFFEQSRIASDETTQFLGVSFTGNPTIEFPDYTPGLVYKHTLSDNVLLHAALSSSNGLADNPDRSYSELFQLGDDGKGVFAIASATWKLKSWLMRTGVWINSADHQTLDTTATNKNNYGAYVLGGYKVEANAFNVRVGMANEDVSRGSGFASVGYQFTSGAYVTGLGVARIFLSTKEPDGLLDDTDHYELYLRYKLNKGLLLTGDVQRIVNSDFGSLPALRDRGITVYGLRLTWLH